MTESLSFDRSVSGREVPTGEHRSGHWSLSPLSVACGVKRLLHSRSATDAAPPERVSHQSIGHIADQIRREGQRVSDRRAPPRLDAVSTANVMLVSEVTKPPRPRRGWRSRCSSRPEKLMAEESVPEDPTSPGVLASPACKSGSYPESQGPEMPETKYSNCVAAPCDERPGWWRCRGGFPPGRRRQPALARRARLDR